VSALVRLEAVSRRFPGASRGLLRGRTSFTAVDDVSLEIARGEAFGLVGESGSGKSTLARMIVGLLAPSQGRIRVADEDVRVDSVRARRALWRRVQYVHQNPRGALNPRLRVERIVGGPLESLHDVPAGERAERVRRALERVDLDPDAVSRRPHAFSGGQAQRIAIARAIVGEPDLLVLDEPTSALDVRVQAEVLALLHRLREELGTTLLFISHDLPVVAALCARVGVLERGRLVEEGPRERVFGSPRDDYTRRLVESVPRLGERLEATEG